MSSSQQLITNGEETNVPVNLNQNGQGDCMYHAVYVPPDDSNNSLHEGNTLVYLDKLEALKVMKKYKGARLKTFSNREDAEDYSLNTPTITITNEEKSSNFKGPKPQELVAFRKLIESGDLEAVKNIVWENPRYLVSSGDTPAILQEGCRYNALHVIASKGQTNTSQMCELILNTVGNPDFVKLLYGEEDCETYVDRAHILLDLYINTPDKGLNETPLHFAAKYGLKDIVRVLVSYPECVKTLPNKYDKKPAEVICSRKCQEDDVLKKDIHMLLEDQYYVPVLRSDDNTLQPTIGDPFSPTSPQRQLKIDPISPRVEVRAFAGPMTKSQAVQFRKKWRTPPRLSMNLSQKRDTSLSDSFNSSLNYQMDPGMRLHDTEKGLERVGRELAQEYHVSWKEYWPFLNDFADFRCDEGLARLEKYLETRFTDSSRLKEIASRDVRDKKCSDDLNDLCANLESWSLQLKEDSSDESDTEVFFTPPSSPISASSNSRHDSDCEDKMWLADEGPAIFIEGVAPTKADFAVYNAISGSINSEVYPFIYHWRHEMQIVIDDENFSFSTTSTRRRLLATPEKPRISKF